MDDHDDNAPLFAVTHRILQIDRDLHELGLQRNRLAEEKEKLRSNIAAKQVKHAPMRTLVPELCGLIFSFYLESVCNGGCAAGFDISPVPECDPLILTHVCRRWRVMVLNNPCLWTRLHVRLNNSRMNIACQIRYWFHQARDIPMSVTVCPGVPSGSRWISEPFRKINLMAMQELKPYLDRIRELSLHVHQAAFSALFPQSTTTQMASLSRLSLEHRGYILDDRQIGRFHSPQLRFLRLCDPSPLTIMLSSISPSLTCLQIDKAEFWEYPRKVPKLLNHCHELQELSIVFPRNFISCISDTIALPKVLRLNLEWYYACSPVPLFRSINAPRLQHLHISHSNFLTTFSHETMGTLRYLMQCSTDLTTLTFAGCNLSSMCEIASNFCRSGKLQELTIDRCYGVSSLLLALSPSEGSNWLPCPSIRHLKVAGLRDSDLRYVFDFVHQRMAPREELINGGDYLRELTLEARLQDFTPQARAVLLRGLSIVRDSVKISGPLHDILVPLSSDLINTDFSPVQNN